ncbi:hypothetical protein P154DRAFT_616219 [Amniculicola lignicola CBS 123094]|uniref:Uncharacterized protein n=1 Tax=Amniculicola lignicola CBS 123094 TaxID=1392246 RepID=A0A6A5WUX4_9PLEO|nr:hypothetical protein P154DRAFT_616219 [Amniculicola lignicola CBS 123094]
MGPCCTDPMAGVAEVPLLVSCFSILLLLHHDASDRTPLRRQDATDRRGQAARLASPSTTFCLAAPHAASRARIAFVDKRSATSTGVELRSLDWEPLCVRPFCRRDSSISSAPPRDAVCRHSPCPDALLAGQDAAAAEPARDQPKGGASRAAAFDLGSRNHDAELQPHDVVNAHLNALTARPRRLSRPLIPATLVQLLNPADCDEFRHQTAAFTARDRHVALLQTPNPRFETRPNSH